VRALPLIPENTLFACLKSNLRYKSCSHIGKRAVNAGIQPTIQPTCCAGKGPCGYLIHFYDFKKRTFRVEKSKFTSEKCKDCAPSVNWYTRNTGN